MLREWEQALQQHGHSTRLMFVEDRTDAAILAAFTAFCGWRRDHSLWPRVNYTTDSGILHAAFTLFWAAAKTDIFTSLGGDLRFPELTPTMNGHTLAVLREIPGCTPLYLALVLFNHSSNITVICSGSNFPDPLPADTSTPGHGRRRTATVRSTALSPVTRIHAPSWHKWSIRRVTVDLAKHFLIEGPCTAITAMQDGFIQIVRRYFSEVTVEHMQQYYEPPALPHIRQILERLQCAEPNQDSVRVFGILSDFPNRHRDDETLLWCFLHYATGSTNARENQTLVHVSQDTQEIRHSMCFSTLHLPVIEDNEEAVATFNIQIKAELKNAT